MEQLRTAKKTASAIAKAKNAMAATAGSSRGFGATGEGAMEQLRDVPEWVTQQLPDLLRLLEACRLLSNVSDVVARGRAVVLFCCTRACRLGR